MTLFFFKRKHKFCFKKVLPPSFLEMHLKHEGWSVKNSLASTYKKTPLNYRRDSKKCAFMMVLMKLPIIVDLALTFGGGLCQ